MKSGRKVTPSGHPQRRFKYRGGKQAGPANLGELFGGRYCRHPAPFNKLSCGRKRREARRFKLRQKEIEL